MSDNQTQFKVIPDLAEREANRRWDETNDRLRYSVEYAQSGMKGLFLANGGAIISLLTFIGNTEREISPVGIRWAFVWFTIGLIATIGAYLAAYLTQGYAMHASFNRSLQAQSDSRGLGRAYDFDCWEKKCDWSEVAGLSCAVAALLMFAIGAFVALDAIA